MTVSSTTTRNSYTGDGTTTVFAYTFKIFDDDDITVILRTTATGTETVQTKTTDYSVSGVGVTSGGNITFVTAPTAAQTVVLLRQTAQTQTTDYTPNDPFPAASHEDALDKLTLIQQDQQDELDRAIKLSRTNTMTSTEFTVGASTRANKILAFDSSGELAVTQEIGTFTGDWASGTSYQQRDIIKDTSNDNIYIANTAHTSSGSEPISSNTDSAKWDLLVDAAAAATSASAAASSATAAAASATAAAASESAAATSETNAAASEAGVAADAAAAAASASAADTSATNASTSETNAAASASAASTSETNAATSATSASTSASAASTSASNAATSATNASNSASAASTSASNAATSETNAATSETNASNSASSASTSASNAATSAAAAEAAFDAFDDVYLGAKASAPTVDNDGDALTEGDQYFNTTNNTLFVWNGSAWQAASPDIVGDTTPQLGGDLDLNGNDITGTGNVDITGTLTADGLTVDGDTQLGNTSSTGATISFASSGRNDSTDLFVDDAADDDFIIINNRSTGDIALKTDQTESLRISSNGDISFYDSTGVTQGLFWDASTQRLGVGTTSPSKPLHVEGEILSLISGGTPRLFLNNGATQLNINNSSGSMVFAMDGDTERVRITSAGNVGIGTSSLTKKLEVIDDSSQKDTLDMTYQIAAGMSSTSTPAADAGGGIGFMGPYNGTINTIYAAISGEKENATSGNSKGVLRFGVRRNNPAANMEAMRIDSLGNLLVGCTDTNAAGDGVRIRGDSALGLVTITRNANRPLAVNRRTSDGDIIELQKDGTTVGSIGNNSTTVYYTGGGSGIRMTGTDVRPTNDSGADIDNARDLGDSSARWKDLYLSGGVYLGGTGSANLLDDYEEGSFSPSLGAVSTSTNAGSANYVKIGDMVFCRGYIAWTGLDTGDGSAFQFTLPFAPNLTDDNASGNSAVQVSMNTKETTGLTGILADVLGARIVSTGIVALTGAETDITYNSGVDASGEFHFHISYRAT